MLGEIVKPENSNCSGFLRVHAEEDVNLKTGQQRGGLNRHDIKPVGVDAALDSTGVRISLLETSFDDLLVDAFGNDTRPSSCWTSASRSTFAR
jgi:hypothetical protein